MFYKHYAVLIMSNCREIPAFILVLTYDIQNQLSWTKLLCGIRFLRREDNATVAATQQIPQRKPSELGHPLIKLWSPAGFSTRMHSHQIVSQRITTAST